MAAVVIDPPADFASVQQQFRATLHVATAEVADIEVESSGDEATAAFAADLGLQGLGHWAYEGTVDLQRVDGSWGVAFTPASLHPALTDGARIQTGAGAGAARGDHRGRGPAPGGGWTRCR